MKKMNVAVMAGGNSSEREVSLASAMQVAKSLNREKYNVYFVDIEQASWSCRSDDGDVAQVDKNDFSVMYRDQKTLLEYALIVIHGTPGEDGKLQGYLEMMGIGFSSCDMVSTVITFDKQACKRAVEAAGVNVAKGIYMERRGGQIVSISRDGEVVMTPEKLVKSVGLPMFVKPNASGSSFGVTKVREEGEILVAIENALKESKGVLVEEFLDGRELGCGIVITSERDYILPLTEIVTANDFFDYEAKYTPGVAQEITPAVIDPEVGKLVQKMAKRAYVACGCRGLVRVDFIVRKDSVPFLIEINSVPGMSAESIVPKQLKSVGMEMGEMMDIIIEDTRL